MSPEAQRIAIAEACGWKRLSWTDRKGNPCAGWRSPGGTDCDKPCCHDYLNDLNAMHEAEEMLSSNDWEVWWRHMGSILPDDWRRGGHITAAQRAEAFLKTLGKWEDGK